MNRPWQVAEFDKLNAKLDQLLEQQVSYTANCCLCGRIVDTREHDEGGDKFGAQLEDNHWVCSIECWEAVVEPDINMNKPDAPANILFPGEAISKRDGSSPVVPSIKGLDPQVLVAARNMTTERKQEYPQWVFYDHESGEVQYARWPKTPAAEPYIRADIALDALIQKQVKQP